MKARDMSVSVSDFGGELQVMVTFKVKGSLNRESPNLTQLPGWSRVSEAARKAKAKEIQRLLEVVEFP